MWASLPWEECKVGLESGRCEVRHVGRRPYRHLLQIKVSTGIILFCSPFRPATDLCCLPCLIGSFLVNSDWREGESRILPPGPSLRFSSSPSSLQVHHQKVGRARRTGAVSHSTGCRHPKRNSLPANTTNESRKSYFPGPSAITSRNSDPTPCQKRDGKYPTTTKDATTRQIA